jgi:hypothetical protein
MFLTNQLLKYVLWSKAGSYQISYFMEIKEDLASFDGSVSSNEDQKAKSLTYLFSSQFFWSPIAMSQMPVLNFLMYSRNLLQSFQININHFF